MKEEWETPEEIDVKKKQLTLSLSEREIRKFKTRITHYTITNELYVNI
jgi:hypothetical protein